ncbi:hypothetical protein ACL7TT_01265 [Microbulbifer sp. 2304DJ12-6]|uniref:hypothetical protein n=1 Tax=Microbulbifer sp. 2304DJ12-6 TaxID=3233340 RepID=UPI0039B06A37
MNYKQRLTLICTAIAVFIMVIFPPYVIIGPRHTILKAGYGFLLDLPLYEYRIPATVDAKTLLMQILAVLIICGLAFTALKKKEPMMKKE